MGDTSGAGSGFKSVPNAEYGECYKHVFLRHMKEGMNTKVLMRNKQQKN